MRRNVLGRGGISGTSELRNIRFDRGEKYAIGYIKPGTKGGEEDVERI
jgi:hypothetical protein